MSQMKQFHTVLNQSVIVHKEVDEIYRKQVDAIIESVLRNKTKKNQACIIGAGACRDFSLSLFLDYCTNILVTDIDQAALKKCVGNKTQMKAEQVEYTGFDEHKIFEGFAETMWQIKSKEEIDKYLKIIENQVNEYVFLEAYQHSIDFLFVSPIYTQLLFQQFSLELQGLLQDGYDKELIQYFQEQLLTEMVGVIERFNRNLVRLLNPGGSMIVLSDIFELDHGSDFYRRVKHSITQKDVMDELYQGYVSEYGMGFGDYGLHHLDQLVKEEKSRWLLWRFNEGKSFAVKAKSYIKPITKGGTI